MSLASMIVSESTFADLVHFLCAEHEIVSLSASPRSSLDSARIPVALTFDDGWSDNAAYAAPILARNNAPATIFLCPEKMGDVLPFWPERISAYFHEATRTRRTAEFAILIGDSLLQPNFGLQHVIEAVKKFAIDRREVMLARLDEAFPRATSAEVSQVDSTMTWDLARSLSKAKITLGSHTLNHEILTRVPVDLARVEVTESGKRVSQEIGQPCFAFAYPNGDWSPRVRDITASAGYTVAFANRPGLWGVGTDPFAVPRVNLWEGAVTGPLRRFSKPHFEYVVFHRAIRAAQKRI